MGPIFRRCPNAIELASRSFNATRGVSHAERKSAPVDETGFTWGRTISPLRSRHRRVFRPTRIRLGRCNLLQFEKCLRCIGLNTECKKQDIEKRLTSLWFTWCRVRRRGCPCLQQLLCGLKRVANHRQYLDDGPASESLLLILLNPN